MMSNAEGEREGAGQVGRDLLLLIRNNENPESCKGKECSHITVASLQPRCAGKGGMDELEGCGRARECWGAGEGKPELTGTANGCGL